MASSEASVSISDKSISEGSSSLETMISYAGEAPVSVETFDLSLFKQLNAEFAATPVVTAPRPHHTDYTTQIGRQRARKLADAIGIDGLRVLEIGCGDGMLSRVLAREHGCEVVGVDVSRYDGWEAPIEGDAAFLRHDIATSENAMLGHFDRAVSFAVFEHIVHPHAALKATFDMLRPGGKAYIYANLYRGPKASHRYREVFFPWPHLLFPPSVWQEFYRELAGEPLQAAWVNKLTYDQYVAMAQRIGFTVTRHFPSAPYFHEELYRRFEYELAAYPKFDLMHDFIHLVLEKPSLPETVSANLRPVHAYPSARVADYDHDAPSFWRWVRANRPDWLGHEPLWRHLRREGASPLADGLPWVTFPAIDYLDGLLTKASRVFEWGSGGSTLFFAERAGSVTSVEHDRAWYETVRDRLTALPNVSLRLIEPALGPPPNPLNGSGARNCEGLDFGPYAEVIEAEEDGAFDLVLVDGRARMGCLAAALSKVAGGGVLMLDNADYGRYRERLAEFRAGPLASWREIDLGGPGPFSRTAAWETLAWVRPSSRSEAREEDEALSPQAQAAIRSVVRDLPLRPYDAISYLPFLVEENQLREAATAATVGRRFELAGFAFSLGQPIDWQGLDLQRSGKFFLQAWDVLEPLLAGSGPSRRDDLVEAAWRVASSWIEQFGGRPICGGAPRAAEIEEDFVTADVAVSGRFYRLAYLACALAARVDVSDAAFGRLLGVLLRHVRALMRPDNFSAHSNHGLLQALAQICGASRFADVDVAGAGSAFVAVMAEAAAQGQERLAAMLDSQVAVDGAHREHSPMYHAILANALDHLLQQGLVTDPALSTRIAAMRACAGWMTDGQGRLANLGDSDLEPAIPTVATPGAGAVPDTPKQAAFRDGGYWFVKGPQTYLAQTACFHGRAHKQADTGAFLWRDRGLDILIDAGRFGYVGRTASTDPAFRDGFWYADVRRRYVESTRAHNTLSLDGGNHPRFRAAPFGSTIVAIAERDGVFACESRIPNLPSRSHVRLIALKPGSWLVCIDTLRAPTGQSGRALQHFHLHPDWRCLADSETCASYGHALGERLHLATLLPGTHVAEVARGRGDPERDALDALYGWWSPRHMAFEPCEAISLATEGEHVTLATLLTFGEAAEVDAAFSGFNASRRRIRLRWTDQGGVHTLSLAREVDDQGASRLQIL